MIIFPYFTIIGCSINRENLRKFQNYFVIFFKINLIEIKTSIKNNDRHCAQMQKGIRKGDHIRPNAPRLIRSADHKKAVHDFIIKLVEDGKFLTFKAWSRKAPFLYFLKMFLTSISLTPSVIGSR